MPKQDHSKKVFTKEIEQQTAEITEKTNLSPAKTAPQNLTINTAENSLVLLTYTIGPNIVFTQLGQLLFPKKTANVCDNLAPKSLPAVKNRKRKKKQVQLQKVLKREWRRLRRERNQTEKEEIKKLKNTFYLKRKLEWVESYLKMTTGGKNISAVERIKRKYENQRRCRERRRAEKEAIQKLRKKLKEECKQKWISCRKNVAAESKSLLKARSVQKTVNVPPNNPSRRRKSITKNPTFEFCDTSKH